MRLASPGNVYDSLAENRDRSARIASVVEDIRLGVGQIVVVDKTILREESSTSSRQLSGLVIAESLRH